MTVLELLNVLSACDSSHIVTIVDADTNWLLDVMEIHEVTLPHGEMLIALGGPFHPNYGYADELPSKSLMPREK